MALTTNHRLYEILNIRQVDLRKERWLWFFSIAKGFNLSPELFNHPEHLDVLAQTLEQNPAWYNEVLQWQSTQLVPDEFLSFIDEKNKRQICWLVTALSQELSSQVHRDTCWQPYQLPANLSELDRFLVALDCWPASLQVQTKRRALEKYQREWNEKIGKEEQLFKWFTGKEEAVRCRCAWEWLREKNPHFTKSLAPFTDREALLSYFDLQPPNDAQRQLDVEAIKRRMNQRKYRERQEKDGKRQCNFVLSSKAIDTLDTLAQKHGLERPAILEILLQGEADKGLYIEDKLRQIRQIQP